MPFSSQSAGSVLERDRVRTGTEFMELIEPDRIAFVLSLMSGEIVFSLRRSNCQTAQSADRIV
jgi:hypothetical protein